MYGIIDLSDSPVKEENRVGGNQINQMDRLYFDPVEEEKGKHKGKRKNLGSGAAASGGDHNKRTKKHQTAESAAADRANFTPTVHTMTVYGKPQVEKDRELNAMYNGHGGASENYWNNPSLVPEKAFAAKVKNAAGGRNRTDPIDGKVSIEIDYYFSRPSTADANDVYHDGNVNLTNLDKFVQAALMNVCFTSKGNIVTQRSSKFYCENKSQERTEIKVQRVDIM